MIMFERGKNLFIITQKFNFREKTWWNINPPSLFAHIIFNSCRFELLYIYIYSKWEKIIILMSFNFVLLFSQKNEMRSWIMLVEFLFKCLIVCTFFHLIKNILKKIRVKLWHKKIMTRIDNANNGTFRKDFTNGLEKI